MTPITIELALKLALQHHQAGQLQQAERIYREILAIHSDQPQTLYLLGSLLLSTGRVDEAIAHFQRVIAQQINLPELYNNLGIALKQKSRLEEAIAALREAIRLRPNFAEAYSNLGNALKENGQPVEAMEAYRQAVALRPDLPEARNHLGQALHQNEQIDEAIAEFQQAIRLRPNFAEAHNNLGVSLLSQGKYDLARAAFEKSAECRPDYASAHHNLGIMMLLNGDYERGWVEYEWRWKVKELNLLEQNFPQPIWDGSDLNGRRIFLHSDQAFGDAIQFARYVPLVAQRGGKIIMAAQPAIQRLMRSLDGVEQVVTHGDPLPPFDVHCALASLPRVFKTTIDTIPTNIPYIRAQTDLSAKWKERIGASKDLKIGLSWAGRAIPNPHRSVALTELAPLAQIPDATFFSLQKGAGAAQAKTPPDSLTLVDWTDELSDFADTAALIDNLDLLITIDTAVGHLAGAMGKPVYMLVPFVPDWRWMLGRPDSLWYPSVKLFRQPSPRDWATPIREIVQAFGSLRMTNQ